MKDITRKTFSFISLTTTVGLMAGGLLGIDPFVWDTGAVYALLTTYGCLEVLLYSLPGPYAGRKEAIPHRNGASQALFSDVLVTKRAA